MSNLISAINWHSAALDPSEPMSINPPLRRADFRRIALGLKAQYQALPYERVALLIENPVLFAAALIALLGAGKKPVLTDAASLASGQFCQAVITEGVVETPLPLIGFDYSELKDSEDFTLEPAASIELYTSGSTGKPKKIVKTLRQMDAEAALTSQLFSRHLHGTVLAGSADCAHLYGLTFMVWMALTNRVPVLGTRIRFPEDLERIGRPLSFITTPTFLHYLDVALKAPCTRFVLSASGPLSQTDARRASSWFGVSVHEIYGSTETGVMGTRSRDGLSQPDWTLIEPISLVKTDGGMRLDSPLLDPTKGDYFLDDEICMTDERHFVLLGRKDRVIKIGEKRFSLDQLEEVACQVCGANVCLITACTLQSARPVAIVESKEALTLAQTQAWRKAISQKIDPIATPRIWRQVSTLPRTPRGKIDYPKLKRWFADDHFSRNSR